jgi:hypothetical protein
MSRGADARRVGEERKVGNGDAAANRQTTRPNADGGPRSGGPRPRTKRTKNKLTGPAAETTLVVEVKIAIDELERPYALVTIGGKSSAHHSSRVPWHSLMEKLGDEYSRAARQAAEHGRESPSA